MNRTVTNFAGAGKSASQLMDMNFQRLARTAARLSDEDRALLWENIAYRLAMQNQELTQCLKERCA